MAIDPKIRKWLDDGQKVYEFRGRDDFPNRIYTNDVEGIIEAKLADIITKNYYYKNINLLLNYLNDHCFSAKDLQPRGNITRVTTSEYIYLTTEPLEHVLKEN